MGIKEIIESHKLWLDGVPSGERAVLDGMDLAGANLNGVDLRKASIRNANLCGSSMKGIILNRADISGSNFAYCEMENADLRFVQAHSTNFARAQLKQARLLRSDISGACFKQATLRDAALDRVLSMEPVDFDGASLVGANLFGARLAYASFNGADLFMAHFEGADMRGALLRNAICGKANFSRAWMTGAVLPTKELNGVQGNGREILSVTLDPYDAVITKDVLQVGCTVLTHKEWMRMPEQQIHSLDDAALGFYHKYKAVLAELCSIQAEG